MSFDEKAEKVWKWLLRLAGLSGFAYLLIKNPDVPVAFYVLLGGLLGLPNVIQYQMALNEERKKLEEKAKEGISSAEGEE